MKKLAIALLLSLTACGGGSDDSVTSPVATNQWQIGPIIGGTNYSSGVPVNVTPDANGGLSIDIPQPTINNGSVHYVTQQISSFAGKTHIVLTGHIENADGAVIVPYKHSDATLNTNAAQTPSFLTVYFAQKTNDWQTDGQRWWATFATVTISSTKTFTVDAPLDGAWTSVQTYTAANNPTAFANAKSAVDRVGFTLGGGDGYGHGVYATGQVKLVIDSFKVE